LNTRSQFSTTNVSINMVHKLTSFWRWLISSFMEPRGPALLDPSIQQRGSGAAVSAGLAATKSVIAPVFGARRPLIDQGGCLAGFEFRLPPVVAERLTLSSDAVAVTAHAAALLVSMRVAPSADMIALIELPMPLLERSAVLEAVPPGIWLAIAGIEESSLQTPDRRAMLAKLARAGVKVGSVGQPIAHFDFVVLDATDLPTARVVESVTAARTLSKNMSIIATGIGNINELECLLSSGVTLAAGLVDRSSAVQRGSPMSPRLQQVFRLIHHVVSDEDLVDAIRILRRDVELSYQLLRHANSATNGFHRAVGSVDQAVILMGRDGLYQWLTMLLLKNDRGRHTSRALSEIALSRARLMEVLAQRTSAPASGMFTLGLLSLLDVMLQVSMEEVLDQLPLAPSLRMALVDAAGEWYPALELARALEGGDLGRAAQLAQPYGGLQAVVEDSDQAWRWAAEAARAQHA
jgi:c-di-GMP-related signal transduction protein